MRPEQRRLVVWEVAQHLCSLHEAPRQAVTALRRAFEDDRETASAVAHSYYLFEPFGSLERQVTMLAYLASKAEVSELDVSIARDVLGDDNRFNHYCRMAAERNDL